MLAFPSMIVEDVKEAWAAESISLKVPESNDFDVDEYPHFAVMCGITLGKAIDWASVRDDIQHNALIVGRLDEKRVRTVTFGELVDMGVRL